MTTNSLIGRTGWEAIVDLALSEDIGTGDITTQAIIPAGARAHGAIVAKQAGVVSGVEPAGFVFHRVDPRIVYQAIASDGDEIAVGDTVATVAGPARSVLTGERVALNLLQRLSGVATMTHAYVQAVEGTGAVSSIRARQPPASGCSRRRRSATAAGPTTGSALPTAC